jgi:hypothetical protein
MSGVWRAVYTRLGVSPHGNQADVGVSQSAPVSKSQPQKTVSHAAWVPGLQSDFDISPKDFREMGLSALTTEQEMSLLVWASGREQKVKESAPSFESGRPGQKFLDAKPEEYDKVRVYVIANGSADEIISGVRERLRTMNGLEVVYTSDEADLTVNLVAMESKTTGGSHFGTATSVVVTAPCTYKVGTYTHQHASMLDQFVQVGSDTSVVISSIVSSIDTDALDNQRKANAEYKKYLQDQKKKK